ncbi:MAG: rhodanese-like domain-containing protein [Saprospiraceae bacterium]|nr:rhodanese-like domain-containing protein [Saprospiraceae bacterium]
MAWNSFLKNFIGGEQNEAAELDNTTDNNGAVRNENLSGRAFKKQLEAAEKAVLLDVRTAGEFSGGTIPGSKNIDFLSPTFSTNVKKLDKDATYFLFCRSGNRSGQACKIMHSMGFDVRNLSGGIGEFPA